METSRDKYLWRKARNRVAFKSHALIYVLVNAGMWILYLFMRLQPWGDNLHPWPVWGMIGWGIGLAAHYFSAYGNLDQRRLAEEEYEKLLRKEQQG